MKQNQGSSSSFALAFSGGSRQVKWNDLSHPSQQSKYPLPLHAEQKSLFSERCPTSVNFRFLFNGIDGGGGGVAESSCALVRMLSDNVWFDIRERKWNWFVKGKDEKWSTMLSYLFIVVPNWAFSQCATNSS